MNELRKRMERSYDSDVVVRNSVVARQSEDGCEQWGNGIVVDRQ